MYKICYGPITSILGDSCRDRMRSEKSATALTDEDVLTYFTVEPSTVREAFPKQYPYDANAVLPRGGCRGLQARSFASREAFSESFCRHIRKLCCSV